MVGVCIPTDCCLVAFAYQCEKLWERNENKWHNQDLLEMCDLLTVSKKNLCIFVVHKRIQIYATKICDFSVRLNLFGKGLGKSCKNEIIH